MHDLMNKKSLLQLINAKCKGPQIIVSLNRKIKYRVSGINFAHLKRGSFTTVFDKQIQILKRLKYCQYKRTAINTPYKYNDLYISRQLLYNIYFYILGDYMQYQYKCTHPKCIPCEMRFHSCKNLPNGKWPLPERPHYITYIKCENGRKIEIKNCPIDSLWGVQTFPYIGQCVQLFAIPKSYNPNGALPSCTGKDDGNYQFPVRYCNGYYVCENGFASAVKCPNNTVFDSVKKICKVDGHCVY